MTYNSFPFHYPVWNLLSFLVLGISSHLVWKKLIHFSFNSFIFIFSPDLFRNSNYTYIRSLGLFFRSLRMCSFYYYFFFFCSSIWIVSIAVSSSSLFFSSAVPNQLIIQRWISQILNFELWSSLFNIFHLSHYVHVFHNIHKHMYNS